MTWLIRKSGNSQKAHWWGGEDTACRMWSTGGMSKNKEYLVSDERLGKDICTMCANVILEKCISIEDGATPQ